MANMAIVRKIAENTLWLFLGRVVIGILHLATMVLLARYLGVADYGKFVFAMAFLAVDDWRLQLQGALAPFNCPHATEISEPHVRWHATIFMLPFLPYNVYPINI